MNDIQHYCDTLKLPYIKESAEREASDSLRRKDTYADYLKRLLHQEVLNRFSRSIQVKIKKAQFPSMKTWESFDMTVLPEVNPQVIAKMMTGEYIQKSENIITLGSSGTGKTHLAIALGLAACQQGHTVLFQTAAHLVHSLIEAHDARKLLSLQRKLMTYKVLIIDELGYVPFSNAGAQLLFEVISKRYEQGSLIITSNLPFEEWTHVFGSNQLTGALLDRVTHHAHIIPMNGTSYRVTSRQRNNQVA